MLEGVCGIASAIGVNLMVEEVETKEQFNVIDETCDSVEIQGYLCASPLPFEEFYYFAEIINLNSLQSLSLLF